MNKTKHYLTNCKSWQSESISIFSITSKNFFFDFFFTLSFTFDIFHTLIRLFPQFLSLVKLPGGVWWNFVAGKQAKFHYNENKQRSTTWKKREIDKLNNSRGVNSSFWIHKKMHFMIDGIGIELNWTGVEIYLE